MKYLHARTFPLVLGYDFSGVVEALGAGVGDFELGAAVFGFLPYGPGNRRGAFAEALIARTDQLALKPPEVSHAQAAAGATPGLAALQSLRDLARMRRPGLDLASEMGADRVIDRMREDVVKAGHGQLDVVFDASAAYRWRHWRSVLDRRGTFVTTARGVG